MWIIIVSCIILLSPKFSTTSPNYYEPSTISYQDDGCQTLGNHCQSNADCCSDLICYSSQDTNLCLPSEKQTKRVADVLITPPYYDPMNRVYPYENKVRPYPFYNAHREKQPKSHHRNKMEWSHCQFHEDCGEGYCCYAHFRFRSIPKSFCRPNRNEPDDLCEPLTKYHSLKDVPAWKKHKQQQQQQQQQQLDNKNDRPFSLNMLHTGQ